MVSDAVHHNVIMDNSQNSTVSGGGVVVRLKYTQSFTLNMCSRTLYPVVEVVVRLVVSKLFLEYYDAHSFEEQ